MSNDDPPGAAPAMMQAVAVSRLSHVLVIETRQAQRVDECDAEDGQLVHEVMVTLSGTSYALHLGRPVTCRSSHDASCTSCQSSRPSSSTHQA